MQISHINGKSTKISSRQAKTWPPHLKRLPEFAPFQASPENNFHWPGRNHSICTAQWVEDLWLQVAVMLNRFPSANQGIPINFFPRFPQAKLGQSRAKEKKDSKDKPYHWLDKGGQMRATWKSKYVPSWGKLRGMLTIYLNLFDINLTSTDSLPSSP